MNYSSQQKGLLYLLAPSLTKNYTNMVNGECRVGTRVGIAIATKERRYRTGYDAKGVRQDIYTE